MALTREYRETVVERLRADREFTAALFSEAIAAFVEGDKQTALSILRDLVHAHISFKTLSEQTGFDEKGLHRMLSSRGNPTTQNLSTLLHIIEKDLDLRVEVKAV
jgi:DNA-binding phage protein